MPVSHIGLTVSHLPTSCSFFLAALTPLGYHYLGQEGYQIAFGVKDADFFISQESSSVKATAAHIAFTAPSRSAVDAFFSAALKAGGQIHGEPAVRDQETGYYSAAVLDFDGNSIEVMHRDRNFEPARATVGNAGDPKVLSWQKDVAKSTAGRDLPTTTGPAKVTVNNVMTPTMVVTQSSPETKPRNDISSKAMIGTLLGAVAGAAVAYAMTKAEEESPHEPAEPRIISYRAIEAPKPSITRSVVESRQPYVESTVSHVPRTVIQQIEYPEPPVSAVSRSAKSQHTANSVRSLGSQHIVAPIPPRSTLIDTFIPPSEVPRYLRPASLVRSHTDSQIRSSASHAPSGDPSGVSRHSRPPPAPPSSSGASSAAHTVIPADFIPAAPASAVTEVRIARDMPLPDSRAASSFQLADAHGDGCVVGGGGSVAPSDSISQAGSKKSRVSSSTGGTRHSRRSRQTSSSGHGHRHSGGGGSGGDDSASRAANRANESKAARRESNDGNTSAHGGSRKRESAVSLPLRPASSHSRVGSSIHHRRSLMGVLGA
ncbi:hypothetical protein MMC07_001400 [Pseudocyphellaria aurata]|nr:hypothetical protein [Pseudocyphellaria aurata]